MVKYYLKPYIPAKVTPEVQEEIQGETVVIDDNDLSNWNETVSSIKADFINWLRGKPTKLTDFIIIDKPKPKPISQVKPYIRQGREVRQHTKTTSRWTKLEESNALKLWRKEKNIMKVSTTLGRTYDSTRTKLQRLRGIKKDYPYERKKRK